MPVPVTVRLSQPLGQRSLVDGSTGHQHPVLDAAGVPTPSYLPPGYGQMTLSWDETQADIVSRSYQRLPRAADGNDQSLLIERRPLPDQPLYNEQVLARGTVLGRPARVAQSRNFDDEVCAIWSDQQHAWWVCSMGGPEGRARSGGAAADRQQHPLASDRRIPRLRVRPAERSSCQRRRSVEG